MSATRDPNDERDRPEGAVGDEGGEPSEPIDEAPDSGPMRALLRRAMLDDNAPEEAGASAMAEESVRDLLRQTASSPLPAPQSDVLQGVQRKIRLRSQGKFYADGWSTREEHPRSTYLVTAGMMLLLVIVVILVLIPGGIGRP